MKKSKKISNSIFNIINIFLLFLGIEIKSTIALTIDIKKIYYFQIVSKNILVLIGD